MRSMPWLDADLAQSRTLDSGESPSCFFMAFMVNFLGVVNSPAIFGTFI